MDTLYRCIETRDLEKNNRIFTVLKGSGAGQKLFLAGDQIVWKTGQCGYLEKKMDMLKGIHTSGIIKGAGTDGPDIFCEVLGNLEKLVVCGGGHVSVPIICLGKMLGFEVTVLEDRPLFADNARKAGADRVICEEFSMGLKQISGDKDTYFVIVTRGHRFDSVCLKEAVMKPNAYVGMMGSRKRAGIVKENLITGGIDRELINRVYTPIGLSIGAETPEEIAVAVMAQIIQVRNKGRHITGYQPELLERLNRKDTAEKKKVLATIVSRKGSAPRETGTKMLVEEDGVIAGTIGGGCAESAVIQKALLKMRIADEGTEVITVDMTGREAEDEGMVCGGTIEVLLEPVNE